MEKAEKLAITIFQLTAARRRLVQRGIQIALGYHFNSQPREGGWGETAFSGHPKSISTHSRAKAAGKAYRDRYGVLPDFNSQPREGGWPKLGAAG